LGRTGRPFYFQKLGLKPHLVAVGKSLGAGVPMGAALVQEEVAQALSAGDHGSTFGGNLLACRAALFFLHELTAGGLLRHVSEVGIYLEDQLRALAAKHPAIVEVRGAGLMWGLELNMDATAVLESAVRQGLLVNRTAGNVIRLLPPLTITEAELDRGITLLNSALSEVLAGITI
jgi:acetylornithine/succinyldiaminopimelate/putrescine aminotransferase